MLGICRILEVSVQHRRLILGRVGAGGRLRRARGQRPLGRERGRGGGRGHVGRDLARGGDPRAGGGTLTPGDGVAVLAVTVSRAAHLVVLLVLLLQRIVRAPLVRQHIVSARVVIAQGI